MTYKITILRGRMRQKGAKTKVPMIEDKPSDRWSAQRTIRIPWLPCKPILTGWQGNLRERPSLQPTVEELVQNTDSPFTAEIMRVPLPRKFKMSQLETFNGSTD